MAIASMTKVMIASHKGEAKKLLSTLQKSGMVQILNAERALITKKYPELNVHTKRMRELEETIQKLATSIEFLDEHTDAEPLTSFFKPLSAVNKDDFDATIEKYSDLSILDTALELQDKLDVAKGERENILGSLQILEPWSSLDINLEDFFTLSTSSTFPGTIPTRHLEGTVKQIEEAGGIVEIVNTIDKTSYVVVVVLNDKLAEIHKLLRACEFEAVNLEDYKGSVRENLEVLKKKLNDIDSQITGLIEEIKEFSSKRLELRMLYDYYQNLYLRETARKTAPSTETTILFEGWVKKKDFAKVQKIVASFESSSIDEITPGEDESVPVDIENTSAFKPFEVITRLYGMPQYFELDPTAALAPFFAIFFGLCLTDAGYGIVVTILSIWFLKKMQGDKKFMALIAICSVATIVAGALTGGWFGDAAQQLSTLFGWSWFAKARNSMMWFDPFEKPMTFFALSLALGYIHIMTGLFLKFFHELSRKEFAAAVFDALVWIVMINCIAINMFGNTLHIPAGISSVCGKVALVPAVLIFLFSHREGGIGARLGMGAYNLFSTVFYLGDVLSYLRLMALGMVTGGLAMAFNTIAISTSGSLFGKIVMVPLILIGGHAFNIAINVLGAFVHTLRLQFVEFFPKFMDGGGVDFTPLKDEYKYVYVSQENKID